MIEFTTTITVVLGNNRTVESIKMNINLKNIKNDPYGISSTESRRETFLWTILIRTATP